jgi:hypothetical protein
MEEKIKEVIELWDTLPKSKDDDTEFVIIAENDDSEPYETNKECLGILKDGSLVWVYLSGCSCGGNGSLEKIEDITVKRFKVNGDKNAVEFYDEFKCEPYEADYQSY